MADELRLSQDLVLRKYADWRIDASRAFTTMGVRLFLSHEVWNALTHHAHLECRMLCEAVVNLPRELRDIIYDALLDGMDKAIPPNDFLNSLTSWLGSLPHLKASLSGQVFLHEFMGLFYSQASFKLAYKVSGRLAPEDGTNLYRRVHDSKIGKCVQTIERQPELSPFSTALSDLVLKDPFDSAQVPATLIDKIEITIPRNFHEWEDASPAHLLEVSQDIAPIKDSTVKIVISARQYRPKYPRAKSCYRQPPVRQPKTNAKEVLRRLEPALTHWTELGVDVQLNDVLYGDVKELYPKNSWLTQVREEAAAMQVECRESNRPGLRKLGGVRKRYA